MSDPAKYNSDYAASSRHGIMAADLGASSWADVEAIRVWQSTRSVVVDGRLRRLTADGRFGPLSVAAYRAERPTPAEPADAQHGAIIDGRSVGAPAGVIIRNWIEDPALLSKHTSPRKRPVTQFVIHRGSEAPSNDPKRTKRILDARRLSSLFTLTPDGCIHQHFDPFAARGRHAIHHNVQSDSIDVQGPLTKKRSPLPGQTLLALSVAIGLAKGKDGRLRDKAALAKGADTQRAAVLARKLVAVKEWSLTPAQQATLRAFVPWWCALRGIPLRACANMRTFRVGGLGIADPVTDVTGILAHGQIAGPGERVDGFVELHALQGAAGIAWRDAVRFWDANLAPRGLDELRVPKGAS